MAWSAAVREPAGSIPAQGRVGYSYLSPDFTTHHGAAPDVPAYLTSGQGAAPSFNALKRIMAVSDHRLPDDAGDRNALASRYRRRHKRRRFFFSLQIRASIPHFSRTTLVELRFTRATH